MITLTHPGGLKVEVETDQISEVFENDGVNYTKAAKTVVVMENGHFHAVLESLAEVDKLRKGT